MYAPDGPPKTTFQPDGDKFYAFLNVDSDKQVSKNMFTFGCMAMGSGLRKLDVENIFDALLQPGKSELQVRLCTCL